MLQLDAPSVGSLANTEARRIHQERIRQAFKAVLQKCKRDIEMIRSFLTGNLFDPVTLVEFEDDGAVFALTQRFPATRKNLSTRELQVARLASEGVPKKIIARDLGLSFHTVKNCLGHVYSKLDVHNLAELTRKLLLEYHERIP